jgi:hypothetical protein
MPGYFKTVCYHKRMFRTKMISEVSSGKGDNSGGGLISSTIPGFTHNWHIKQTDCGLHVARTDYFSCPGIF